MSFNQSDELYKSIENMEFDIERFVLVNQYTWIIESDGGMLCEKNLQIEIDVSV